MMSGDSMEKMKEKLAILSKEREAAKRLLESAVDSLGFSVVVDEEFSFHTLFEECARKVRTFISFESLAFIVFSQDGLDMSLEFCDPPSGKPFLEQEMLPLIEDRTFAWAVDRNRPVIVTATDGRGQILLHSMTTQNRTVGMFMGYLGEDDADILDLSFAFLTVVLSTAAGLLQNAELYTVIRGLNSELSKKIERLEESERNLAEAMRARDTFLANVSHEIRTPLNGILGMATLLEDSSLDSRQADMVRILRDESSSLLRLINDLLDFSRIEAGRLSFEDAPFDFTEFWNSIRGSFLPRARQKNLRFRMELTGEVPETVSGDSLRIRQVFGNVIGNALKFTSKGEVSVLGEILPGDEGWVVLRVDVRDTGIGISAEQAARLFRPFVQGDPSTTRKYGGTGLGLVISRRLLEGMGGSISIEPGNARGAHLRFCLPLKLLPGKSREKDDDGTAIRFPPGYSVLVVEDNETSRMVAVSLLEKIGVPKIETAEDGAAAIEKLSLKRYDFVFMDIQMPVMDGLETVAAIRDASSPVLDHQVPVAAMTANILPADREKYLRFGMTDYITKPVLPEDLAGLLLKSLGANNVRTANRDGGNGKNVFRRDILLARMGGDEKLCEKTIQLFVGDSLKLVGELAALLESGDLDEARMKAHNLRGAAANVESGEIMAAAAAVEEAAAAGKISDARALVPGIFAARRRFLAEIFHGEDGYSKSAGE
ncbi:response regulator [Aminivibrio sp.]|jgi:signal transduction histidine kinase/CheY-like chemotaxis protein|uniref:response regulator n=1 Tax=Aminivibrio sp. TaxID=1872489 RepID=UPI001A3649EF|nr:response regulator [Aminivibrio sp.]MBL3539659.1 response regulator [Aminivibrio sp.]